MQFYNQNINIYYTVTGDDPSNHSDLPRLPSHLSEHERDPLIINPEVCTVFSVGSVNYYLLKVFIFYVALGLIQILGKCYHSQ